MLDQLKNSLQAQPVSLKTLPADLVATWKTKEGLTRVEALPRGDPNDNDTLRKFAAAVLVAEPNAIGGPVSILKSGETVVKAFIHAGITALVVISFLLWLALRRITDVLLTLVPLLVAGAVTLEICVLIGLPLNFANIVALPLLLGVGVAFKIYYVTAWRSGRTNLLQSSLTRAIFFSALTTATAFGSLWLSSHPGTASMGKLLALSLVTTLAAVLLFQPALMGLRRHRCGGRWCCGRRSSFGLRRACGLRCALGHAVGRAGGNRARDAGPVFAAAQEAQHAALNFKLVRTDRLDRRTVEFSVLCVIDFAFPLIGDASLLFHADQDRHPQGGSALF